jgi:hypothetical protein
LAVPLADAISSPLILLAVLLLTLGVYAPTLNDWFAGDDIWFLRGAKTTGFWSYTLESFDFRETNPANEINRYRPLYPVFWRIQYEFFGMNATGYHVVLVALHLANTALVWFIAKRLFHVGWAANLAALIFALHPAYADAVTWLSGGNRTVAAFSLLLCVASFMVYRSATRWRFAWYAGSLIAFVAAILLHSSALGVAMVLPAYAALIHGKPRDALRPTFWLPFLPFLLAAAGLGGVQAWVRNHLEAEGQFAVGPHQFEVMGEYLSFAVVPVFASGTDVVEPWRPIVERAQSIALVAMIGLGVILIAHRRLWTLGLLASGWLIVALLPDTTLDFPVQGRLLYMPGVAIALFLVAIVRAGGAGLGDGVKAHATLLAPLAVLAVLIPALFLTVDHASDTSVGGDESQRFTRELRQDVPSIPEGGAIFVVNPPANLYVFGQSPLEALVEIYYGPRDVHIIQEKHVTKIEESMGTSDRLFHFHP